ncbi:MAG: hypothetical protein ACI9IP_002878, partial [Arcticibacterium sp.]
TYSGTKRTEIGLILISGMAQFKPKSLALTLRNYWHYLKRNSQSGDWSRINDKEGQKTYEKWQINEGGTLTGKGFTL